MRDSVSLTLIANPRVPMSPVAQKCMPEVALMSFSHSKPNSSSRSLTINKRDTQEHKLRLNQVSIDFKAASRGRMTSNINANQFIEDYSVKASRLDGGHKCNATSISNTTVLLTDQLKDRLTHRSNGLSLSPERRTFDNRHHDSISLIKSDHKNYDIMAKIEMVRNGIAAELKNALAGSQYQYLSQTAIKNEMGLVQLLSLSNQLLAEEDRNVTD